MHAPRPARGSRAHSIARKRTQPHSEARERRQLHRGRWFLWRNGCAEAGKKLGRQSLHCTLFDEATTTISTNTTPGRSHWCRKRAFPPPADSDSHLYPQTFDFGLETSQVKGILFCFNF